MATLSGWARRNALFVYFILAYAISWAVQIPLALQAQGLIQATIPPSIHYLAGYGPMLAAVITTWLVGGANGVKELLGGLLRWRVAPVWWLVAVSPISLYVMVALGLTVVQGQPFDLGELGQVNHLPYLGLGALFLWILTYGIGEETGWRGFALPRLQKHRSALQATLLLWIFWALWHLPAFFYLYDPAIAAGFLLGTLAGAIVFTWLYNSTGGSILVAAVFHGVFNLTTGCVGCKAGMLSALISTMVMVWAVFVVIFFKPAHLSAGRKHVI